MNQRSNMAHAVVVGLCSHGLETVRSLAARGVVVHAVESDPSLPGTRTNRAQVHFVEEVNGPGLILALRDVRDRIGSAETPVLFLMNDNMVREVASRWDDLEGLYQLSWANCRGMVRKLQQKSELAKHCQAIELSYPKSFILEDPLDLAKLAPEFPGPLIVKPVRPLSRFKVKLLDSIDELGPFLQRFHSELPFVIQNWIPGGDEQLIFCALFLDRGRIVTTYTGQKIRSMPPALGGTSMARTIVDDDALRFTQKFFDGLDMSGPVSLEVKRGPDGRLWVIEPTVGRTDFWLKCCTANGVDFPFIEYCHVTGVQIPDSPQRDSRVWIETEMDPLAAPWYFLSPHGLLKIRRLAAFPFFSLIDTRPFASAMTKAVRVLGKRVVRRIRRQISGTASGNQAD